MEHHTKQSVVDMISGFGLVSVPLWVQTLDGWLQTGCLVTGTILGTVGVARLVRGFFRNRGGE